VSHRVISGSSTIAFISRASCSMIGFGVCAAAMKP